jgi:hypothetical protein
MSTVFAERPSFFEGQYLGADDLEAFLKYARECDARHLLGAHTWGIVAGIDLVEGTSPAGEIEYSLTPGVAVDGYGRLIVVTAPFKLTTDLFAQQPTGSVEVWIRHEESPFGGARPGFRSCECSDAYARVAESFVVEVGRRATVDQRESGVQVGDEVFADAREALGYQLPGQPLACDGSVAAQAFPGADSRGLWLIPVGQVPWSKPAGGFLAASEAVRKASLIFRRTAGLVTGHIYPASGVIRLGRRWSPREPNLSVDQICALDEIRETDLVTCKSGELDFREMIWLEGHSRFTGDVRLYGARLEFLEALGTDYLDHGVPLAMRRRPRPATPGLAGGFDLEVLLGQPQGSDGPTRLAIGKATAQGEDPCAVDFGFAPGVFVQEDARLGIGTPDSLLNLPLTIRAIGETGDLAGFQASNGSLAWQINFGKDRNGLNFTESDPKGTRLFLQTGGNVGIGVSSPEAKLDIREVPVSGGNALGSGRWFQVGNGDDSGRMWLQYGGQLAPLLVLSDKDDPPRLQFQQTGGGQEAAPQFSSWIGHARNNSPDISLMGGNVGINTPQPFRRLHVEASEVHSGGAGAGFSFGNREDGAVESPGNGERWVWYSTGRIARLWSGSDKLSVTPAGNLGIATDTPAERLDVRGNIKLGAGGNFFGVGCLDNLRMIAGSVGAGGNILSGSGFTVTWITTGHYRLTYWNGFLSVPIVVATLVDSLNEDNFLTVTRSSATGFDLRVKDDEPGADASAQNSAFNFIALGLRA